MADPMIPAVPLAALVCAYETARQRNAEALSEQPAECCCDLPGASCAYHDAIASDVEVAMEAMLRAAHGSAPAAVTPPQARDNIPAAAVTPPDPDRALVDALAEEPCRSVESGRDECGHYRFDWRKWCPSCRARRVRARRAQATRIATPEEKPDGH